MLAGTRTRPFPKLAQRERGLLRSRRPLAVAVPSLPLETARARALEPRAILPWPVLPRRPLRPCSPCSPCGPFRPFRGPPRPLRARVAGRAGFARRPLFPGHAVLNRLLPPLRSGAFDRRRGGRSARAGPLPRRAPPCSGGGRASPGRPLRASRSAGRLAGWFSGWLAGWLAGLARWLAGPAGRLSGLPRAPSLSLRASWTSSPISSHGTASSSTSRWTLGASSGIR